MDNKTIQTLSAGWQTAGQQKLKLLKGDLYPALPEEEVVLPEGTLAEDYTYCPLPFGELQKPKDYLCIVHKGQVISQGEMPILFPKTMKEYCRNVALELEGTYPFKVTHIRRADKVFKALIKLGFTNAHKVVIFQTKEDELKVINKFKEADMPSNKIKEIIITYQDGRRTITAEPDNTKVREIIESIKPFIPITTEFKPDSHIVFKREYFEGAPQNIIGHLSAIEDFIISWRESENKPIKPSYIVVNMDEPYADQVLQFILEQESLK